MSELLKVEAYQEPESFVCDSDMKADWIMKRIREARADRDRMVAWYKQAIADIEKQTDFNTAHLESLLFDYFQTVPHKATKTQESYSFPGGKLTLKKQNAEYKRDDATVIEWLKANGQERFVKVKEELDWSGLKAETTVFDGNIVNADGEIIPGVTVTEREPKFIVE